MIQSRIASIGFAQPLPHQRFAWANRSTPTLERYELDWQTASGHHCHCIVIGVFAIYYACIEIRASTPTIERWARQPLQTAAAARTWVEAQLLSYVNGEMDTI